MSQPNDRLMPIKEALKIIPVSREAFYRKLKSGELPSYRLGRKILVDVGEIKSVMRQGQGSESTGT